MPQLHDKILELRKTVGASPILFAHRKTRIQKEVETRSSSTSDNPRLLKQYFAMWGIPDDYGTMPMKGCFSKSIKERGPDSKANYKITALYMHSQCDSVGLPIVLIEDEIGLYAEVPALEGVQVADELVIRHKAKVCNNGSYGFNYVWDKMEYDDKNDVVVMKECDLFEISFVTIGSQTDTYGVRNAAGEYTDEFLTEETEDFIKRAVPRKDQLELRNIINRHITLAKNQPLEIRQKALEENKPKHGGLDYQYLIDNLKLSEL